MAITVDLSTTDDPTRVGGKPRVTPGPAHLQLIDFKENAGRGGEHIAEFEVLMHPDQSQVGMTHTEYYPADAEKAWKILMLAYAVKVTTKDAMKAAQEDAKQRNVACYVPMDFQAAVGRQLFGTFKVKTKTQKNHQTGQFETKDYHNFTGLMAVDDPAAANYPRNAGMLAKVQQGGGGAAPTAPSGQTQAAKSAANPFAGVASVT